VAWLTGAVSPAWVDRKPSAEGRKVVRDSLAVTLGGQIERVLGTLTALAMRWWLDPARLGVYTGLRLYLDNTNRSSLGIGLGAVQEIPVLRAAGREDEAKTIADLAYTTNTLTCLAYAVALLVWAWLRAPVVAGDPLAAEWTWGLVAVAGLTLIKRYESFLVAILRAHGEFTLTAELDVVESLVSALVVTIGLVLAGFWGLLAAVAILLLVKIAYAHARHPLRFCWAWDGPTAWRLMWVGLPILANTAVFGAVVSLDRMLILWRLADGDRAAGLYTIAIMGTSWSLDLSGRLVLVMYRSFQTTMGRTSDPVEVAHQAARATEAQAPVLLAGSAVAYLLGPVFLGTLMPRYAEGLPAMRPLLPGMIVLGLAWPARQMLIAIGRPYLLCLATLLGLTILGAAGTIGADRGGIVGVARGMSIGYAAVFALTSAAAFVPLIGLSRWARHLARLFRTSIGFMVATLLTTHFPLGLAGRWTDLAARAVLMAAWLLPTLWRWGRRYGWGGVLERRIRTGTG
jgi:O-antigen/teichoic acid export membrane protein